MKVLIIDNYDSYTFNLYQQVAEITKIFPQVYYNDQLSFKKFGQLNSDAVIISPGPGNPVNKKDFGISYDILAKSSVPVIGVCLGHQGIASVLGGEIIHAPEVMHGRTSKIYHSGLELFADIPQGFTAVRYHSLIIDELSLATELQKTAWTNDQIIMGIKHKIKPQWGVQFHPESIGTEHGMQLMKNFLSLAKNYESH